MTKWKKQSHVVYQCSYYIVWCPKYRFRILLGQAMTSNSYTLASSRVQAFLLEGVLMC